MAQRRAVPLAFVAGITMLVVGGIGAVLSTGAHAATLTSGPVSLTTTSSVTGGTPYSSGQVINISVGANTTMDQASLEAAGYTSGAVAMKAEECADPGGLPANLPTKTSDCQFDTVDSIPGANVDGSFNITNYTVYALPNNITFGEGSSGPTCDDGDECVIGLFANQNDFTKPHIFSAAFFVQPNADDGGENPGDGSQPVATPVSSTNSTIVAAPTTATADGVDLSKVTVTLEDTGGAPMGGKQVTLSQGSAHSIITVAGVATDTATTDALTGMASFNVTDASAEAVAYTAADSTDGVSLSETANVTFATPVVTAANSTLSASPTTVPSGGTSMITVTLDDQAVVPQPIAGEVVALSQGAGHSVITAVSATTGASGQATFSVTDTSTETITYTATADGAGVSGKSVSVTFGTLTVAAAASTVTASPPIVSSAASGGVLPTGTVTVTLLAADGTSAVMGKTVTLVSSSENAQITPAATPDVTDTNGRATFQVSDGTAEMVTFTATDASDAIQITTPVVVTFAQPTASASKSVVNGSALAAPSDGVTSVAITVTVMDQFGHPLSGKAVTLTGSPATTTRVAPQTESTSIPAGITDANGKAVFFVYDTAAETVVYTATDTTDNVVIDQTASVTYGAGLPQVNNSTLSANPTSVPADGTTSSTVTVGLEDHNSNPVPGKTITLTATGGSSTITPVSPMTDSKGDATFKVTDTTSEVVFYTASDTSDSLPLAGQGVTVTFGTPPPILPAIADSTIVAEPSQVPADGSTNSTITVVLADADGNVVSGRTVALNPANGSSSVTTVTGVTDVNGEATFTVTDKDAEKVTYTATDVTDSLPIAGQSVAVVFTSTGTATTTTTTTSSTTTTTTSGQSSTSTTTSVPAAIVSTASSSGASGSGDSTTGGSTGTGLAFTGAPDLWPWMVGLGGLLIFMGAVGRRALRPHDSR